MADMKMQHVDRDTLKRSPIVTFTLKDGAAVGKWAPGNDDFRHDIEQHGIVVPTGGVLYPKDGQKFLAALELGFANSSQVEVIKVDS